LGFERASATNSLTLCAGEPAGTTSTLGNFTTGVIGAKSLMGSKRKSVDEIAGVTANRPLLARNSVAPSGAACLAASAATTPPPPERLSMTILVLVLSVIFCARSRVTTSEVPPGGNGTRMLIGRVGNASP
jgi:hypothetical protein